MKFFVVYGQQQMKNYGESDFGQHNVTKYKQTRCWHYYHKGK